MRIDRLDVYHVSMPLIYPWRTAYGEDHAIDSVLVKATSGDVSAWSEATPFRAPHYVPESAGSVYHLVTEIFGPLVVGREFDTAADLDARLAPFKGNGFAKAAVELLWWTLETKCTGTPLHTLLGGSDADVIAGADFGILDSFDDLLADMQKAVDAGFPRIKLKARPGWDVEMLRAVRGSFPDTILHIDCKRRLHPGRPGHLQDHRPVPPGLPRTAAAVGRRSRPRRTLTPDRDAHLPGRVRPRAAHDPAGPGNQRLSVRQHQTRPLRRPHPFPQNPRYVS